MCPEWTNMKKMHNIVNFPGLRSTWKLQKWKEKSGVRTNQGLTHSRAFCIISSLNHFCFPVLEGLFTFKLQSQMTRRDGTMLLANAIPKFKGKDTGGERLASHTNKMVKIISLQRSIIYRNALLFCTLHWGIWYICARD